MMVFGDDTFAVFVNFLRLFRDIPEEEAAIIEQHVTVKVLDEGEVLFKGETICRHLYFISHGVLRIVMENEKGQEVTYHFLKENQFCTILESFTNRSTAKEGIHAACAAAVVVIQRQQLDELYGKLPYLKPIIDQVIHQGLLLKVQNRNAYQGDDAAVRYRNFLIRQPEIALRVPLAYIASYLGITPQSLSRIRRNLR